MVGQKGEEVFVQQIKDLLPELGESAGTHTLIMPHFWDCRKRTLSIPEVSPKSSSESAWHVLR
jgi:hypothetical protein